MTFSFRPIRLSTLPETAASSEYPGRFLERSGRNERLGLQRCLGNPLENGERLGRLRPSSEAFSFTVSYSSRSISSPDRNVVSPGSVRFDLLQHLAGNHLDMLIVDFHALQPIDLLNFVDQVIGQHLDAHNSQDVVRHRVAVHQRIAPFNDISFLNRNRLTLGQKIFDRIRIFLLRMNEQAALVLVVIAKFNPSRSIANNSKILGFTGFSSATRGRPPVISRVFDPSSGIRASTSPAWTRWPASTDRIASTDGK